jgi:hypothetical protein
MNRLLIAFAVVVLALAGCEKEVEQTQANVTGSWEAPFADCTATITLASNGNYMIEQDPSRTAGSQLFQVGAWGKIPPGGQWRLGEGEVSFMVDGATAGGLEIVSLYEDRILFKAQDGSPMFFNRVATATVPSLPSGGTGDDGDVDDDAADDDADMGDGAADDAAMDEGA